MFGITNKEKKRWQWAGIKSAIIIVCWAVAVLVCMVFWAWLLLKLLGFEV